MNKLIKITTNEQEQKLVSARELHGFLEVTERFQKWFDKKIAKYEFIENEDFTSVKNFTVVNNGAKREIQDYAITLGMEKELSMVENNENDKEARRYFISYEDKLNEIVKTKLHFYLETLSNKLWKSKE
ncbi:antA/AntB antirepressor family protein [Clostridium beijerinckii]|uniref:Phage anti-repressor protein n=1 Tax=Clostridium beijerinckii TaxID=1520 RepID=A0AAE5H0W1_CLOBE|nr:antA/AntB antirepressor family protein [Clostridium beijerinckii]NSB12137.1 phage anti-repressor protein [Clostridium beijerinckii]OOM23061.1 AntA/AntB antirepressor [Clostridium beijerinckii]